MATFWERAAHSVYRMFSLYFDIVILVISHFVFEGGTLVLIATVPGHCLPFTSYAPFEMSNKNMKVSSFKSYENIQKKGGVQYCTVSNNKLILFSDPE